MNEKQKKTIMQELGRKSEKEMQGLGGTTRAGQERKHRTEDSERDGIDKRDGGREETRQVLAMEINARFQIAERISAVTC